MRQFKIIKDINENFIVSDETTRDVWFWKTFVDHSEVVDSKKFIESDFVVCNFFVCSVGFSKGT